MTDLTKHYLVGEVLRPHGVKGGVKLKLTADIADMRKLKTLFMQKENRGEVTEVKLLKVAGTAQKCHVQLEGVNDCNQAESLRGSLLYADQNDMPSPKEGEYFYRDIEHCSVYNSEGKLLGEVEELMESPAHLILVIKKEDGEEELLPFINDFIATVDIGQKRIDLHPYSVIE